MSTMEELKRRAKAGDLEALQVLRESGFFKKKKAVKEGYAVSHAQKRLWILDQIADNSTAYMMPGAILLEGRLDVNAFRKSLETIVVRHESLRTTFVNIDNEPRQIIHDKIDFQWEVIDLCTKMDADQVAREYAAQENAISFDLKKGPLLRLKLLQLTQNRYVFLFNIHHIVSDEWSMGVFVRELTVLYEAEVKEKVNPLPTPKIQYKDYAAWHNTQLEGKEGRQHRRYWHNKLSGPLSRLGLITDIPRPPVINFAKKTFTVNYDRSVKEKLSKLGSKHGASFFMILVTLLKVLLYRYTGQRDIIIGTPIAGRDHPDIQDKIGLFVNLLALRDTIAGEDSFIDLLKCIKQTAHEAYEHQIYPFDRLVDELDLERDLSRPPIFDVLILLQNVEQEEVHLGDVRISEFDSGFSSMAEFDLMFGFAESDGGLNLALKYRDDLFCEERIRLMAEHLKQLMNSVLENVDAPISQLNILSDAERQCLLIEWNQTSADYPFDKTIVSRFEEQAAKTPNHIAVVFGRDQLSYQALNAQANQLARYLRTLGVFPDSLVGLCIERSPAMVVGLLGILKAGGTYVPIDPTYPKERIVFMLEDSRLPVLLSQQSLILDLPATEVQMVCLDTDRTSISNEREDNLACEITLANLAYVIYTSGSTGQPKGVLVAHQGLSNLVEAQIKSFRIQSNSRVLQFASFSFDASVSEIFTTLGIGATLYLGHSDDLLPGHSLMELLREQAITHVTLPPSALSVLPTNENLPALQTLVVAGEACPAHLVEQWSGGRCFLNAYGPTESTVCTTIAECTDGSLPPSIGRPMANVQVYILDESLQPVPVGVAGELHISGTGLAQGYMNRPNLTADKFIDNPFRDLQGFASNEGFCCRMYKTGDLARYLPNGNIEYLGRLDDQVKVRGFRIEPGEIERCLQQHNAVVQAVVLANESLDGKFTQELNAYLVVQESYNVQSVRNHLGDILPEYMVPTNFISVSEIPLTLNGKVDKRALLKLSVIDDTLSEETLVAPRTDVEKRLAGIWTDVLGIKKIGIHDVFFERGGHSLKATQMVSKVYSEMEVKIGLREVFNTPTLLGLAELINSKKTTVFVPIEPLPEAEHYTASNAQRRLWVLERMGADIAAYNITGVNLLKGQLNVAALEKTLQTLIARHESLRTTFVELNEELQQKIQQTIEFKIEVIDLTTDENPEESALLLVSKESVKPYDLKKGPLFKAKLYCLDEECSVFLFGMHHIISDGWSLDVFIKELLELYNAFVDQKENPLPPLRIQYKDYAQWQNNLLTDEKANSHRDYWLEQFSGEIPVLDLPTDYPRPTVQTFRGGMQTFSLSPQTTDRLRKLGTDQGASFFMILLSLVKALMYRYTGQEDIIIGSPVANREHPDLSNQIGFYVNMLALQDTLRAQDTFVHMLEKVKDTVTNAFEHQTYPFDRLVEELELKRDMGRNPLFDVAISMMQKVSETVSGLSGVKVFPFKNENKISKFDLTFFFEELADSGCEVNIEYSTDLFQPKRIERMAGHFRELVNSVIATPHRPLKNLNIMPAWERQKVVVEFNDTYSDYPRDKSIAEVFETQVEKTPDNPAVICGDTVLTYQTLNQKANGVARLLRERYRIKSEECVGVLLDRSEWTAVALVSILKAGGAYVPIDPAYPHNRISYILNDTGCRVVLSEEKYITGVLSVIPNIQAVALNTLDEVVTSNLKSVGSSSNLAYVIYTSGSTGIPKGSLIEQRSVLRLVLNTNYIDINEGDRILQTGSLAFDASTFEVWGALLNGACLCLPPEQSLLETSELKRLLQQYEVTTIWLTSSLFNQLLDADISIFKGLKNLLTGGEKLSAVHIYKVKEAYPYLKVINGYGPTENTTFTACYCIENHFETDIPVGSPIANSIVYILDGNGQTVPIGVTGEIYAGGDGVARGYLNQPVLTNEKFIQNPIKTGGVLYKIGDLGRWRFDGNIEFIGRIDNQVKVRGFRVELGEIEDQLLKHSKVNEAVVIDRETTVCTKELIAYVSSDEPLTVAELRLHLTKALPNYMIPAHIVQLNKLPLTVNGKVARRALPAPETTASELGNTYITPSSVEEKILANIWEGVLGQKPIGLHDNYFELGGDSIKAIQVASRLMRDGWKMEVRALFNNPTIAELAPQLLQAENKEVKQEVVIGQVPLTAIQHWFFEKHSGDLHHFNQAVLLRSQKPLDESKLQTVLRKLCEHHDALRMTYQKNQEISGTGILQNNAGLEQLLNIEVVDLREKENEITALESHADSVQAGFTLEKGLLIKAILYRLTAGDRLLLVIHHLVVDGVSWRIIIEDIDRGYRQALNGDEICFGAKTVSFKNWAEEVQRYATCETLLQESAYWSSVLKDTSATSLPGGFELEENLYGNCKSASVSFSESETQSLLTGTHHAYYTEINDILLTALGRVLKHQHGGDSDSTWITMEGHGREVLDKSLDISRTVGWFTSMYPFLLKIEGDDPGNQIKSVKEALRQVPGKGVGFGILTYITPKIQTENTPAFTKEQSSYARLGFNYLGQFDEGDDKGIFGFADESSGQAISPRLQRHHDLDVVGMIVRNQLNLSILFNPKQHRPETVEKLLINFKEELLAIVEHCQQQSTGEKTPGDFAIPTVFSLEEYNTFLKANTWKASQIDDIYPLSLMQEGFLFESLYDEVSTAYFIQSSYRLSGILQLEQFKQSWYELSLRHPILRTAFVHENVLKPLQVVFKERMPEIAVIDLCHLTEAEQQTRLETYQEQDMARGFDFQRDTLIRIGIFQLSESAYQTVWSYHHILLDGWCLGIIYQEFAQIYAALCHGQMPKLPATPCYSEYIRWLEQQDKESARDYWSRYLSGYEQLATLPKLTRYNPSSDYVQKEMTFVLEKTAELKILATSQGVTINTILQSLWGLLLSCYNGTDDVVFGATVSGRPSSLIGVEEMVGLFINAVPVRVTMSTNQSFSTLLQTIQDAALENEPYHCFPLAEIQTHSGIGRDLFDHLWVFQNYVAAEDLIQNSSSGTDLTVDNVSVHDQSHYNLNLIIVPGETIQIRCTYNDNVYQEDQLKRIAEHFRMALRHVLQAPEQLTSNILILPERERKQVLYNFNKTAKAYAQDQTIIDLFEAQVKKSPNEVAIIFRKEQLTYRQLDERVNQLAHYLRETHHIRSDDRVGLLLDRSEWMVIGVLGIMKAGGAYVPIDADYPSKRIRYIIKDSECNIILSEEKHFKIFADIPDRQLIDLKNINQFKSDHSVSDNSVSAVPPDGLAYVIYTSGSTGKPKGCQLTHANLYHYIHWANNYYFADNDGGCFGLYSSLSFDLTVTSLFLPLIRGKTLHVFPQDTEINDILLETFSEKTVIDSIKLTPSHILLLKQLDISTTNISLAIVGGEALLIEQARLLQSLNPHLKIYNEYGPTETTVGCVVKHIKSDDERILIGKPIDNTQVYILDRNMMPAPIGVHGGIYIGGMGVSRGYLKRPELTEQKFIPNPLVEFEVSPDILYNTGDVGRWLPDGNLEYHGRNDNQVKIRGYRVELEEIENQLLQYRQINKAVVLAKTLKADSPELVAYVVGDRFNTNLLRSTLQRVLPDFMIPTYFVKLEEMPLTPNGKVDKRALPDPTATDLERTTTYTAPRDKLEEQLTHIWQQVLQIEKIGIHDNFFELGGHSLKVMQVVSRIYQALEVKIALRDMFKLPTIAKLASKVKTSERFVFSGIQPATRRDHYDLSYAQKRLWILHRMGDSSSVAYNIPKAFLFEETLDIKALKKAFAILIERHEALRTVFFEIEGEPQQKIYPAIDFSINEIDISTQANVDDKAQKLVDSDANGTFDLTKPPLLRATLVKLGENRYVFIMTMHHIIGDGWSSNILYEEIITLYSAYHQSLPNPLRPLRIQYKDFALWQNSKGFELEEKYWLTKLSEVPPLLRLPYDFTEIKEERDFRGDIQSLTLDTNVTQELRTLAVQKQTTVSNVILALFKLLLFQLTKQEDFCVGVSIAGRNHPDIENLIGFFVNLLPVRTQFSENMEFEELLEQVIQNAQEAYEYQDYPFDLMIQKLNPTRVANRQPLLNVIYAFQNFMDIHIDIGADKAGVEKAGGLNNPKVLDISFKTSKFDLTLFVSDYGDTLHCDLEYDTDLFLPVTIKSYLGILERFAGMVAG